MNWKRGLFRAWIVLTALWLTGWLAFAWLDPGIPSLMRDCEEAREHTLKALGDAAVAQCVRTWEEKRTEFLRNALVPPILLLIVGVLAHWIVRGFRTQQESTSEKSSASAKNYVMRHWRGEHSLARAFFINGILFYFSVLLLLLGLDYFVFGESGFLVMPMLLLFVVGLVWSFVGIAKSEIKILRSGDASMTRKFFAAGAIGVVALCAFYVVKDLRMLLL